VRLSAQRGSHRVPNLVSWWKVRHWKLLHPFHMMLLMISRAVTRSPLNFLSCSLVCVSNFCGLGRVIGIFSFSLHFTVRDQQDYNILVGIWNSVKVVFELNVFPALLRFIFLLVRVACFEEASVAFSKYS